MAYSTLTSMSSTFAKGASAPNLGTPITLDLNGNPTTLSFWCLTTSITSVGTTADDALYGSSVAISANGQLVVYARHTTTTNRFYACSDWTQGTIYQRTLPSNFATSGQAFNCAISSNAGTSKCMISTKNSATPFAVSNDLGINWTVPSLTGSNALYPDVAITADGTVALACNYNNGFGHAKSTDGMATWQSLSSIITYGAYSCYCSSTSSPFFACIVANGSNSKYTTSTAMSSWNTYYSSSNPSISQACSDDGNRAILTSAGAVRVTLNGLLGASATFNNVGTFVSQTGQRCSMSFDGSRAAFVSTSASSWDCFYSLNVASGASATWVSINTTYSTNYHFTSVHMSGDGKHLIMLAKEGLFKMFLP